MKKQKLGKQPLTDEEIELIENIYKKIIKVLKKELLPGLKEIIDKKVKMSPRSYLYYDSFNDFCVDEARSLADSIIADELYNS